MELFIVVEKKLIKNLRRLKRFLRKITKKNKEPSNEFINTFAKTYGLCLPNDIFFDMSPLFELF